MSTEIDTKTVYEKIQYGYYNNKKEYGGLPKKYIAENDPEVQKYVGTLAEIHAFGLAQKQRHDEKIKELNKAYYAENSRLNQLFQDDLAEEFNLQNHPKKDMLFSKAWSLGHASGLSDVYGYYSELAELLYD